MKINTALYFCKPFDILQTHLHLKVITCRKIFIGLEVIPKFCLESRSVVLFVQFFYLKTTDFFELDLISAFCLRI